MSEFTFGEVNAFTTPDIFLGEPIVDGNTITLIGNFSALNADGGIDADALKNGYSAAAASTLASGIFSGGSVPAVVASSLVAGFSAGIGSLLKDRSFFRGESKAATFDFSVEAPEDELISSIEVTYEFIVSTEKDDLSFRLFNIPLGRGDVEIDAGFVFGNIDESNFVDSFTKRGTSNNPKSENLTFTQKFILPTPVRSSDFGGSVALKADNKVKTGGVIASTLAGFPLISDNFSQATFSALQATFETVPDPQGLPDSTILIDFEADPSGNPFTRGDQITDAYQNLGLTIDTAGSFAGVIPPMIFDSENPTGGDDDLRTIDQGNVLIISEDNNSLDPDDNFAGGAFRFQWDTPVQVKEIGLLDIDSNEQFRIITLDSNDNVISNSGFLPGNGNNQLLDISLDADDVSAMIVNISNSGAITHLSYEPSNSQLGSLGVTSSNSSKLEVDSLSMGDFSVGVYDTDTDTLISSLEDGSTINESIIANRNLSIGVTVSEDRGLAEAIGSMSLSLNDGSFSRVENVEPYALFGDKGGDFLSGDLVLGSHNKLSFNLYSDDNANGNLLGTVNVGFAVSSSVV